MVTNSHFYHTSFAPISHYTAGHTLEVIIVEKDTFHVVENCIDGTIECLSYLIIVAELKDTNMNPAHYEKIYSFEIKIPLKQ